MSLAATRSKADKQRPRLCIPIATVIRRIADDAIDPDLSWQVTAMSVGATRVDECDRLLKDGSLFYAGSARMALRPDHARCYEQNLLQRPARLYVVFSDSLIDSATPPQVILITAAPHEAEMHSMMRPGCVATLPMPRLIQSLLSLYLNNGITHKVLH